MRTCIARALLSDLGAEYRDLGPGYHEQRAGTRRQVRGRIRSLERCDCELPSSHSDAQTSQATIRESHPTPSAWLG